MSLRFAFEGGKGEQRPEGQQLRAAVKGEGRTQWIGSQYGGAAVREWVNGGTGNGNGDGQPPNVTSAAHTSW